MKKKTFLVRYYFDGQGEVKIKAHSEEEATDLFWEGEFTGEKEWGDGYQIDNVFEMERRCQRNKQKVKK